ncbi:MAG: cls [Thermoleophilia bacterium]|nr:cls [Thermoleophilia bacterium]MCZ4496145.1 cls [Thermoleophilia bacterium]
MPRPITPLALPTTTSDVTPMGPGWTMHDQDTVTAAIVDAIAGAKQVVNAEFFVIADAGKGSQVTDALVAAAQRGVEVNVVADVTATGTLPLGSFQRMRSRIEDAGGEVIVARNPASKDMYRLPGLRHVDHRKVVTVDSHTGFVGGMNFSTITDKFHDSMMRMTGAPAAELAADQIDRWQRVGGTITRAHSNSVDEAVAGAKQIPKAKHPIDIVVNAPEQDRFEISDSYLQMIREAKQRIYVTTPGLSDQLMIGELNEAAKRGVDVRVVTGAEPLMGVQLLNWVGRSHIKELTTLGGAGYEIPETIHRKVLVVDDEAVLSSYNLTGRSRLKDHEIGVRSKDPLFVDAVAKIIGGDLARATKVDPAEHTGLGDRFADFLVQTLKISY